MSSVPLIQTAPQTAQTARTKVQDDAAGGDGQLRIENVYWGYVISSGHRDTALTAMGQAVCWAFGIGLAVVALGLWVAPAILAATGLLDMRLGISAALGGISVLLLWYASRSKRSEFQVDTALGELREVVRNHSGRATLLNTYGFDAIGSVFIERQMGPGGEATLHLRYRNTAQTVEVVSGPLERIERLRDRMGRDLLIDTRTRRSAIEPVRPTRRAA